MVGVGCWQLFLGLGSHFVCNSTHERAGLYGELLLTWRCFDLLAILMGRLAKTSVCAEIR